MAAAYHDVCLSGGTDHMELLRSWKLDDRVKEVIGNSKIFKYASELDLVRVDTKLVSFLCNSYRDHLFHIGDHKLFLGLEDIFFLTGLPIDGKPVVGKSIDLDGICERLLGKIPTKKKNIKTGYVELKWLKEEFEEVNVSVDSPDIHRYVRAYLLYVLGCVVFPGLPRHQVPGDLLHLLEDLSSIDDFAWGSAMLAHLHVALERVRDKNSKGKNLSGSCFILQIFALERFPKLSTYFGCDFELPKSIPLAGGWSKLLAPYSRNNNKKFNIAEADQISLTPYKRVLISDPNFLEQIKLCGGRFYLICLDRIWYYSYEYCSDQLGLPPMDNPLPKPDVSTITKCRRGDHRDWQDYYKGYVAHWNNRQSTCVNGLPLPAIIHDEMKLHATVTRDESSSPFSFVARDGREVSPSSVPVADEVDQPPQEHQTKMQTGGARQVRKRGQNSYDSPKLKLKRVKHPPKVLDSYKWEKTFNQRIQGNDNRVMNFTYAFYFFLNNTPTQQFRARLEHFSQQLQIVVQNRIDRFVFRAAGFLRIFKLH